MHLKQIKNSRIGRLKIVFSKESYLIPALSVALCITSFHSLSLIIRASTEILNTKVAYCVGKQWELTLEEQKQTRKSLTSIETLEVIDDSTKVTVQIIEMPFPLWNREVVLYEKKEVSSNEGWIISVSTEHEKAPMNGKKYVRTL